MKNAKNILSPSEHDRVQARIARLETHTDSEVVCAVATESGRYDRAESLCGLTTALVALLSVEKFLSMGAWERSSGLSLGAQTLTIVLGFTTGSVLASYWHGLRRLFTGAREIDAELQRSVKSAKRASAEACCFTFHSSNAAWKSAAIEHSRPRSRHPRSPPFATRSSPD